MRVYNNYVFFHEKNEKSYLLIVKAKIMQLSGYQINKIVVILHRYSN